MMNITHPNTQHLNIIHTYKYLVHNKIKKKLKKVKIMNRKNTIEFFRRPNNMENVMYRFIY
jgi:hypothetical protein